MFLEYLQIFLVGKHSYLECIASSHITQTSLKKKLQPKISKKNFFNFLLHFLLKEMLTNTIV